MLLVFQAQIKKENEWAEGKLLCDSLIKVVPNMVLRHATDR